LQLDEALTRELRHENVQLQKELDDTVDQVREVEAQVVAISQAHQLLADNLMKQKDNIHQISKQAIDARKSVLRGNKELVKASRRGVDFRIFVLLFLLLLSFTLLFLHWVQS
jgi:syntaxin 18